MIKVIMTQSMETNFSIPIHLLRQYCFCPRIPYFQLLLELNPERPVWVRQGLDLHARQQQVFRNRTLKRFKVEQAEVQFNQALSSEQLAMHGVVDAVLITPTHVYPLEFKLGQHKPVRGQILQLVAYAMLLAEKYQLQCEQGFILTGEQGKTHQIKFSAALFQQVKTVCGQIQQQLKQAYLPSSAATVQQCAQCEYLNYCNDRV